jgi:hypothetical protein
MIQLSSEVKYLEISLEKGLTWKKQQDKVINKAYRSFWTSRGTFGKTWGLKPKVVYWIYTAVVRPIIPYDATIWWPRVKLKTSQAVLSKLKRDGLLGNHRSNENSSNSCNGGPPWTPPSPLHLQVEAETKIGNHRLRCNEQWKPKSEVFGHAYMTQDMENEPILQTGSDKMIPRHVYDKPFTIRFPDRSEWKKGFEPDRKGE